MKYTPPSAGAQGFCRYFLPVRGSLLYCYRLHLRCAVRAARCLAWNDTEAVRALARCDGRWHLLWFEACCQRVDGQHNEVVDDSGKDDEGNDRVDERADLNKLVSPGNENFPACKASAWHRNEWSDDVADKRIDDRTESGADDDTDSQVDLSIMGQDATKEKKPATK